MKKSSQLLSNWWPIIFILAAVAIFFYPVWLKHLVPIPGDFIVGTYFPWLDYKWGYAVGVPVKNAVTSDVVSIIYPLRSYAVDILKSGHLPLWNPFMFAGTPLFADFQVAIFSPTMILYFLLPKLPAWTLQIMLQPFLAAVFTYWLLRNFGLKKIESVFGGIFYAFSAFNIIWMEWNTNTLTAAFIPLIILLVDKFIHSDKIGWGVLLSFAVCLQIFSGYPQVVIFTLISLVIFIAFRSNQIIKSKLFYIFLFVILGILLSSVVSIPGSELILNSQRKFEVLDKDLLYLPWQNLITFLAPDYFGNPSTYNFFGIGNYAISSGYSGIIVLCLAIVGSLKYWKKREVKFTIFLFLFSLLLALPTPFAKAFFNLPIPGISASSNTRVLVLANLSIAILAGFGISALLERDKVKKILTVLILPLLLVGVLIITYIWGSHRTVSINNLILPLAFSLFTASLILLREKIYKRNVYRIILILILCMVAIGELFRYGWKYTPFSSPNFVFPETPVLEFPKNEEKPFRVSTGNVIPMNMWVPYGFESLSGYDAAYPIWWAGFFNATGGQDPNKPSFNYYADYDRYFTAWFDLLNNKYLFVLNTKKDFLDKVQTARKFKEVFQDKSVTIFKNTSVFPRATFFSDWETVSNSKTLSVLTNPSFPIEKKILINESSTFKTSENAVSNISYELYSSERSVIDVTADKDGFLFVGDEWYPGWVAKVDGKVTPIYRADYAFRAVPITAGKHIVELDYVPESLKLGIIISSFSLVLLIVIALRKRI